MTDTEADDDDDLTPDDIVRLMDLAHRHELSFDVLITAARTSKARAKQTRDGGVDVQVDAALTPPAASLVVPREPVVQKRQRQAVPLNVDPLTDAEWNILSPHVYCQSRTLPRREMLHRALKFGVGHAIHGDRESSSVASWLQYEVVYHYGRRLRAIVDAVRGQVSDNRLTELHCLALYAERRSEARLRMLADQRPDQRSADQRPVKKRYDQR